MGAGPSSPVIQCLDGGAANTRMQLLEEQCASLAAENEQLRQKVREYELAATRRESRSATPLIEKQSSLQYGTSKFSRRCDDESTLTSAAAIVAAAEATANYQRSLVNVAVVNQPDGETTLVTVRAPNRRRRRRWRRRR